MTLIGDLLQINNMVDERLNLLNKEKCNSIEEYNEKSNNKLPYIFTIIDEFAYYFSGVYTKMVEKKKQLLHDILVKCKKVGIYFICASQRPGTLNKRLRNMFDTKISFKVSSFYDSIIILGQAGAEKLERGDMLLINKGKESIIKAPLPLDSDIERICMGKNKEE